VVLTVRRGIGLAIGVLLLGLAGVVAAGLTDSYGTGTVLDASSTWLPDSSKPAEFWDSPVVDIPGAELTALHCHSRVQYNLQIGATAPKLNPCYAAMGVTSSNSSGWGVMFTLPGDMAVYKVNEHGLPWRYCIHRLLGISNVPPPDDPCAVS
jgi:hypothetical protein